MADDNTNDDARQPGEPRMWFLRTAVILQALTKRPPLVFVAFALLGAVVAPGFEPTWLPIVTGFMVGWWVLWISRRWVARAKAYIALDSAPKPEKVRMR